MVHPEQTNEFEIIIIKIQTAITSSRPPQLTDPWDWLVVIGDSNSLAQVYCGYILTHNYHGMPWNPQYTPYLWFFLVKISHILLKYVYTFKYIYMKIETGEGVWVLLLLFLLPILLPLLLPLSLRLCVCAHLPLFVLPCCHTHGGHPAAGAATTDIALGAVWDDPDMQNAAEEKPRRVEWIANKTKWLSTYGKDQTRPNNLRTLWAATTPLGLHVYTPSIYMCACICHHHCTILCVAHAHPHLSTLARILWTRQMWAQMNECPCPLYLICPSLHSFACPHACAHPSVCPCLLYLDCTSPHSFTCPHVHACPSIPSLIHPPGLMLICPCSHLSCLSVPTVTLIQLYCYCLCMATPTSLIVAAIVALIVMPS